MESPGPLITDWILAAEKVRKDILKFCQLGRDHAWTVENYDSWGQEYENTYQTDLSKLYEDDAFDEKTNPSTGRRNEHFIVMDLLLYRVIGKSSGYGIFLKPDTEKFKDSERLKIVELAHASSVIQTLRWPMKDTLDYILQSKQKKIEVANFAHSVGRIEHWFDDSYANTKLSSFDSPLLRSARAHLRRYFSPQSLLDILTRPIADDERDASERSSSGVGGKEEEKEENIAEKREKPRRRRRRKQQDEEDNTASVTPPAHISLFQTLVLTATDLDFLAKRELKVSGSRSLSILKSARMIAAPEDVYLVDIIILLATEAVAGTGSWNTHLDLIPIEAQQQLFKKESKRLVRTFIGSAIASKDDDGSVPPHVPFGYVEEVPLGLVQCRLERGFDKSHSSWNKRVAIGDMALSQYGLRRCLDIHSLTPWNPQCGEGRPESPYCMWKQLLDQKKRMTEKCYASHKKSQWLGPEMSGSEKLRYHYFRHYASVERYFLRITLILAAASPSTSTAGSDGGGGTLRGVPYEVREHIITFVLGEFSLPRQFLRKTFKFPVTQQKE